MQVVIPVSYNVCEVKLVQIKYWICVHIEDFFFMFKFTCFGLGDPGIEFRLGQSFPRPSIAALGTSQTPI